METQLIFRENPYERTFGARVLSCTEEKNGFNIVLDRTCFYPEGGGQPADLGEIDGVEVLDVREKDGEVTHLCSAPVEVEKNVSCSIDWERRFTHMQHHSGEHIVSGLVNSLYGFDNVGFHMGNVVTVDFNGELNPNDVEKIESLANEAIYKDLETVVSYPDAMDLEKLKYRSKKELFGKIRIVTIPDIDCCACCGTHVRRLGEIGIIKLSPPQKYKGGVRISILCGGKAFEDYREKVNSITNISHLFSAKAGDVFQIVKLKLEETEKLKGKLNDIENRLFSLTAEKMDKGSEPLCIFEENFEPNDLRRLCMAIVEVRKGAVAVVSGDDEKGYRYAIGVKDGDLKDSGKLLNKELNGRGGGDKRLILGTFNASLANIEKSIKNIL